MLDVEFNENAKCPVFFITQIGPEDKSPFNNINSDLKYEDPSEGSAGKIAEQIALVDKQNTQIAQLLNLIKQFRNDRQNTFNTVLLTGSGTGRLVKMDVFVFYDDPNRDTVEFEFWLY